MHYYQLWSPLHTIAHQKRFYSCNWNFINQVYSLTFSNKYIYIHTHSHHSSKPLLCPSHSYQPPTTPFPRFVSILFIYLWPTESTLDPLYDHQFAIIFSCLVAFPETLPYPYLIIIVKRSNAAPDFNCIFLAQKIFLSPSPYLLALIFFLCPLLQCPLRLIAEYKCFLNGTFWSNQCLPFLLQPLVTFLSLNDHFPARFKAC